MANIEGDENDNSITGTAGNDIILGNGGDDSIFGANGLDALIGGAGDDVLYGGIGDDHLEGNTGDNILFGGAGNDSFITYGFETGDYEYFGGGGADDFWSLASGTTVIFDFDAAEGDRVRVEADDFINAQVVELGDYGPALLINGENTDTYLLPGSEEPLDMLDDILFF